MIYQRGWLTNTYVFFAYTETMLRNVPRKKSCGCFVRTQWWWDIVLNNYSDERLKSTFRTSSNTFNYILENIQGGLQKQIVIKLAISSETTLVISLYKLTRRDYHYTFGEMADIVQSTVCRINKQAKKTTYFLKLNF